MATPYNFRLEFVEPRDLFEELEENALSFESGLVSFAAELFMSIPIIFCPLFKVVSLVSAGNSVIISMTS